MSEILYKPINMKLETIIIMNGIIKVLKLLFKFGFRNQKFSIDLFYEVHSRCAFIPDILIWGKYLNTLTYKCYVNNLRSVRMKNSKTYYHSKGLV